MILQLVDQLLELARAAIERTDQGHLSWRRTNDIPREYYASLGEKSALAIRRAGPASDPTLRDPWDWDYELSLVSPSEGELVSVSSVEYEPGSWQRELLAELFRAALVAAEPVEEAVEDAFKVLQEAS